MSTMEKEKGSPHVPSAKQQPGNPDALHAREADDIPVLAQNREFAVIHKPSGIASQPSPDGKRDLTEILQKQLGGEIYAVHRLDRETEGVMVYARTKKAAAALSKAIREGQMEKEYLAIVHGICEEEGRMEDLLFHRQSGNKSFVVDRMRNGVKEARLTYRRIDTVGEPETLSLARIRLETGRTHQIRVQFAHRGHPLYGDGKYGAHSPGNIALFCERITFPDPQTGIPRTFRARPTRGIWERFVSALAPDPADAASIATEAGKTDKKFGK